MQICLSLLLDFFRCGLGITIQTKHAKPIELQPAKWCYNYHRERLKGTTTVVLVSWRRHQMETFSALLALCAGNSPVNGEFPSQRPVTRSFHIFFDMRLNKRLSKQSRGWWFETPSCPLWRHCNDHKLTRCPSRSLHRNRQSNLYHIAAKTK